MLHNHHVLAYAIYMAKSDEEAYRKLKRIEAILTA